MADDGTSTEPGGPSGARASDGPGAPAQRGCPGEKYTISPAICRTRQRNQYPKCLLCRHREEELAGRTATDARVSNSIFRSTAVLGRVPKEINEYVMRKVGLAASQFLRAENPSRSGLAVACDARENSRGFARIFCEGVNRSGADAVNIGTATPELLAYMVGTNSYAGAVFISGWNYPENVSGARMWRSDGRLLGFGDGLEKVGLIARRLRMACSRLPGETTADYPLDEYVSYVLKFVPELEPLTIAVDAGHGTAGRTFEAIFSKLPCELVAVNFEEDAHSSLLGKKFPPAGTAESVRSAVKDSRAHLGAAVDFAGERVAFFDERGQMLRHDVAAGLIASEMLIRSPDECISYDLRSTAALRARVEAEGGEALAGPAARSAFAAHFRRNEALYGADLSGLHYFRSFFRFPSPVLALLMFAAYLGRRDVPASELAAELGGLERSDEVCIPLPSPEAAEGVLARVRDAFQDADRDMIDGVTVRLPDWWFNLRQPGKAAELRLVVEARNRRQMRRGRQNVERAVQRALSAGED